MNLITKLKQFFENCNATKSSNLEVSEEVLNKLKNMSFDHFECYPHDENMTEAELFALNSEEFELIAVPCFWNEKTEEAYMPKSPDEIIFCLKKLESAAILDICCNLDEFKYKCADLLSWQACVYNSTSEKDINKNLRRFVNYVKSKANFIFTKSNAGFVDVI